MTKTVEQSVDVDVDVSTAYNQWTQFETFPEFMEGVLEVKQVDDSLTHWRTEIRGVEREFDAEITQQVPDQRIAWNATSGPHQAGVVTFHRLDDNTTRVMYQMEFEPEGVAESVGAATGMIERQVESDLGRFKNFIESRGHETGEWRGKIDGD